MTTNSNTTTQQDIENYYRDVDQLYSRYQNQLKYIAINQAKSIWDAPVNKPKIRYRTICKSLLVISVQSLLSLANYFIERRRKRRRNSYDKTILEGIWCDYAEEESFD